MAQIARTIGGLIEPATTRALQHTQRAPLIQESENDSRAAWKAQRQ